MKKNLIIFDIDGILAELTPKQVELIKSRKARDDKFWFDFYSELPNQKAREQYRELFIDVCNNYSYHNWVLAIITSRGELYRQETEEWLMYRFHKYEPNYYKIKLFMRPIFDVRGSHYVKQDIFNNMFKNINGKKLLYGKHEIDKIVAIDDKLSVLSMYAKNGVDVILSDKINPPKKLKLSEFCFL